MDIPDDAGLLRDPRLLAVVDEQVYPQIFVTISGAHLYGFPSVDSDFDLRGVHVLPAAEVLGLKTGTETIQDARLRDGLELDLVSHDAKKFFGLMLKRNGYVLEQLYSPLVLHTSAEHQELIEIGRDCITRNHAHHYLGFARNEWRLFMKTESRSVKALLYVYRVLLTGINLMRTGVVEANLLTLNESFKLPYVADLVAIKRELEHGVLEGADVDFHQREYERLSQALMEAQESSALPEQPSARDALHDLLLRVRMG